MLKCYQLSQNFSTSANNNYSHFTMYQFYHKVKIIAVEWLIFLIALIARLTILIAR